MGLHSYAERFIRFGKLTIYGPDGNVHSFGDGTGPDVAVRIGRKAAAWIAMNPRLRLGEAYMDGGLEMVRGDIYDLLEVAGRNFRKGRYRKPLMTRMRNAAIRRIKQWNDRNAAQRNVAHHYDISNDLYRRFLDTDMQYSCAYFAGPGMTLDEAQAAKKAHIASKLLLRPGDRVLDIGCGWGGMAMTLAEDWGAHVTGVTLSQEQIALARERTLARNLTDRVNFQLTDYRDMSGSFDRIVSVGMFEHVGKPHFQDYFDAIYRLLDEKGVALVHAIGRRDEPGITNPWVGKYIFPGGYIPALSEVMPAIERSGLWITDMEIWRLHYAQTARHWRQRFAAQRDAIKAEYDERFCRMFEFYLATSEIAFRYGRHMVFQLQLSRQQDAVPLIRDYIAAAEHALASGQSAPLAVAE